MKNLLLFAVVSAAILINSGCSSKLMSFEKRRYNKGYHVGFAEKKERKNKALSAEALTTIPKQEAKEILTASTETNCQPVPEVKSSSDVRTEETADAAQQEQKVASPEKKKFFQNPILKHFSGAKLKATAKHSLSKLEFKKNTAGTHKTMGTSFFTYLGILLAGGSLVALAVMLFSNWASTMLLIVFISGILLGFVCLIIGANV